LKDIPAHSTAVGIPARVVKSADRKNVDASLDQIHIPDPVAQQIAKLQEKIDALEKELEQLEKK
jgi:serine O-acetyltransferase